jgi:colanic acid/amylovoran biosynthesis protein
MKVTLIHHTAVNTGSVAMVEATIKHLEREFKNPEIVIETDFPEMTKKLFPDYQTTQKIVDLSGIIYTKKTLSFEFIFKNIPFLIKFTWSMFASFIFAFTKINIGGIKILKHFKESDLVLSMAGDAISQDYAYMIRFYEFWLLKKINKPFVLYAQSVGPFDGKSRKFATKGLSMVSAILARDNKTIELMKEYNVTAPVYKTLDTVISLDSTKDKITDEIIQKYNLKNTKKAGIVIRVNKFTGYSQKDYQGYLEGMKTIIENIKENDFNPIFVSSIVEDTHAAKEFKEKFDYDFDIIELYNYLPSQAKTILGNLEFIISPRMHPIILSSTSGQNVPVIGLGREFKIKEYLEVLCLLDNFTPMVPFNLNKTLEILENVIKNNQSQREIIAKNLPEMIKISNSSIDIVKEKVLKKDLIKKINS